MAGLVTVSAVEAPRAMRLSVFNIGYLPLINKGGATAPVLFLGQIDECPQV